MATKPMDTYYARHTMVIGIDDETRNRLWLKRLVAVHSPDGADGLLPEEFDNSSLNPNDHSTMGKRRVNALIRLAKNGGYVYAEYAISDSLTHRICGKVHPHSNIEHFYGKWGTRYSGCVGRTADLLAVQLVHINFNAPKLPGAPARGTLCRWHTIGSQVADLVDP